MKIENLIKCGMASTVILATLPAAGAITPLIGAGFAIGLALGGSYLYQVLNSEASDLRIENQASVGQGMTENNADPALSTSDLKERCEEAMQAQFDTYKACGIDRLRGLSASQIAGSPLFSEECDAYLSEAIPHIQFIQNHCSEPLATEIKLLGNVHQLLSSLIHDHQA